MRQSVLFYSFIVIFMATAVVTLLGVAGVVSIPTTQLNMLLGAFLIELAAAVVALYRRTDFFDKPANNLAEPLGSAMATFDQLSDEIAATVKNQPVPLGQVYRFVIQRVGDKVVAYQRMQVITAAQLDQLPKEQRDLIRTYEKSMNDFSQAWKKIKRSGESQLDPAVRERRLELLREMKGDLVGILDFLQIQGIYLDDHYQEVRSLVSAL